MLAVLTVSRFSGPACCCLPLIEHWEKCSLIALKKRCRWMHFATSFHKLLMNVSGYLSSQCLPIHLPPTSSVRECKMGTARSQLSAGVVRPCAWGCWAASVRETLNQPMHPALPKWEWRVRSSSCALTSVTSKCSLPWTLCLLVVTKEYFLLFKSTQGYRSST